jgi:hypothetical protein
LTISVVKVKRIFPSSKPISHFLRGNNRILYPKAQEVRRVSVWGQVFDFVNNLQFRSWFRVLKVIRKNRTSGPGNLKKIKEPAIFKKELAKTIGF